MTKKHYEKLAQILGEYNADYGLCIAIADMLSEDNPRFDTEKFLSKIEEMLSA